LTVVKHVINDNRGSAAAGDWQLHVRDSGGSDVAGSPQAGSETGATYELNPGTYTVSETGGPGGYNASFSGDCNSSGSVTLNPGESKTCILTNNDRLPPPRPADIELVKTANPASIAEPGGLITFAVSVENETGIAITLDSLRDDIYGDITDTSNPDIESTTCNLATIGPRETYECAFTALVMGTVGEGHVNVVTASGTNAYGNHDTASDDATVTIVADDGPSIEVVKTASPSTLDEPGGSVTFDVTVENTGSGDVTLTSLVDDIHGDLNGQGDCGIGGTIPAGSSYACSFTVEVTGNAGDSETDTVTATVEDGEGQTAQASDSATVTIEGTPPTITVDKTASPTVLEAPGGVVTFSVSIENTGQEDLTLISLVDDPHGDLDGRGTCSVPQALPVGGAYSCWFTVELFGEVGDSETDTITAVAEDDDGEQGEGSDTATVTIEAQPAPGPGAACIEGLKINDDHEPLADWVIRARPTGLESPQFYTVTNEAGEFRFTGLSSGQWWTLWEEMERGWEPVTSPEFEVWIPEGVTECIHVRFKNRLKAPYQLYLPIIARDYVTPPFTVMKEASDDIVEVGETITYTYKVRNSGTAVVTNLTAQDDKLGAVGLISSTLDPGETTSGILTYVATADDLGELDNSVLVTGTVTGDGVVTGTASASVQVLTGTPRPPRTEPQLGCIEGYKRDNWTDHPWWPDGTGLPRWVIHAERLDGTDYITTTMTDGVGYFVFENLELDSEWRVWEESQTGWVTLEDHPDEFEVTLTEGMTECAQIEFINRQGFYDFYLPIIMMNFTAAP
jgi:hypothetical protein